MNDFRYLVPTEIRFGSGIVEKNSGYIASFGKRAMVITSRFAPGCRNYALEDMEAVFARQGMDYAVIDRVMENPPISMVTELTAEVRDFAPDVIVAIGGGSSLDSAKAICVLLHESPERDPIDIFYGSGLPFGKSGETGLLPILAVPTTAGTGAEVSGFAILTRDDTGAKLAISQQVYPTAAFLDSRYIKEAPGFLLDNGAMDALAHGVESYVNTTSSFMNRSIAEIGFKLFASYKDNLLAKTLTDDDFDSMLLASTVMGMSFIHSGTTLPHGMGYPLSHFKRVPHGLASSATLGEYLRSFKDQTLVEPIVHMCGFKSVDEFADYVTSVVSRDLHIELSEAELDEWTDDFCKLEYRFAKHPEPITRGEVRAIYGRALKAFIVG